MVIYTTKTNQDTKRIGEKILTQLMIKSSRKTRAKIVFLTGNLGSGKTFFVQRTAEILGVRQSVVSPSFQIIKVYSLFLSSRWKKLKIDKLVHVDLYRLPQVRRTADLPELFDSALEKKNLLMIEWAERIIGEARHLLIPDVTLKFFYQKKQWQIITE